MQQNRLAIAGVAFVALLGIAIFTVRQRDAALESGGEDQPSVPTPPEIDTDAITELTITRPGEEEGDPRESVTLTKGDSGWRVTAPLEAEADGTAVQTVLDKLAELTFEGVAASNPENHARLEVDAEGGIEVVAKAGGDEVVHFFVGAYRSRSTMLRMDGDDAVVMAEGSIKYAFNKALKEWRNRLVVDVDPARVASVLFEMPPVADPDVDPEVAPAGRRFAFVKDGDAWAQAPGEAPIERFGAAKVRSIVASAARLRAVDFAEPERTPGAAGFAAPTGTITLLVAPANAEGTDEAAEGEETAAEGEEAAAGEAAAPALDPAGPAPEGYERIVLRVGAKDGEDSEFFLMREGSEVIYVVSEYLADRLRPEVDAFQEPEPGSEPEAPAMPPGGLGGLGGAGGQLPPEIMQQLQQQLGMAQ
ncbi:MAG: DUF4340 domain-containing protein [Myxococcota bacterium]